MVGCDFSEPMLELAREKARRARRRRPIGSSGPTRWSFPTTTRAFDAVTVGFGVRNLADLDRGLAEMTRVLKPGGRLVILEITQPQPAAALDLLLALVRPARAAARHASPATATPTRYLPESVQRFPPPDGLAGADGRAPGSSGSAGPILAGGIIAIHSRRASPR